MTKDLKRILFVSTSAILLVLLLIGLGVYFTYRQSLSDRHLGVSISESITSEEACSRAGGVIEPVNNAITGDYEVYCVFKDYRDCFIPRAALDYAFECFESQTRDFSNEYISFTHPTNWIVQPGADNEGFTVRMVGGSGLLFDLSPESIELFESRNQSNIDLNHIFKETDVNLGNNPDYPAIYYSQHGGEDYFVETEFGFLRISSDPGSIDVHSSQIIDLIESLKIKSEKTGEEEALSATDEWNNYTSSLLDIEFSYPQDGVLEDNGAYVRIQNYDFVSERLALRDGEYYIELSFSPLVSDGPRCDELLVNAQGRNYGGYYKVGVRGEGPFGGDAGGYRFSICNDNEATMKRFFLTVTENDPEGPISNAILDTFRFTD